MSKEFGSRLNKAMQRCGMTQTELGKRVGKTGSMISRYVTGEREPKANILAQIAIALDTTSDYLLGIENEEYNHAQVRRLLARNASSMTNREKRELVCALFSEEPYRF